jgi:hypothetical protein
MHPDHYQLILLALKCGSMSLALLFAIRIASSAAQHLWWLSLG